MSKGLLGLKVSKAQWVKPALKDRRVQGVMTVSKAQQESKVIKVRRAIRVLRVLMVMMA
jgi:hypothetical protein